MQLNISRSSSDSPARSPSLSFCAAQVSLPGLINADHPLLLSTSTTASSSSSSPSLYAATKVLSLVNGFRKRVKAHSQQPPSRAGTGLASEFEAQAFAAIDGCVGKKPRSAEAKTREWQGVIVGELGIEKRIEGLLRSIKASVYSDALSLKEVAIDSTLFLRRKEDFIVHCSSLQELQQIQATVTDLLNTLRKVAPPHPSARAFPAGKFATEPALDFTYIANLEHLLLCLQQQLLCLLVHHCVELLLKHIAECQKDHERYCKEWFFEYPDVRHPLSTTWPWNIKPSLVVLWGVCWMFLALLGDYDFDSEMSLVDSNGQIALTRDQQYYWMQRLGVVPVQPAFGHHRVRQDHLQPHQSGQAAVATMHQPQSSTSPPDRTPSAGAHDQRLQAANSRRDQRVANLNTTSTYAAQPTTTPTSGSDWVQPQSSSGQPQPNLPDAYAEPYSTQPADPSPWLARSTGWPPQQQQQQQFQPVQTGSSRPENLGYSISPLPAHRGQVTPQIKIDTAVPNNFDYGCQALGSHCSSATTPYSQSPYTPTHQHFGLPQQGFLMANVHQQQQQQPPSVDESISQVLEHITNGNQALHRSSHNTPRVSPMPEQQLHRKRSHSQMAQEPRHEHGLPASMQFPPYHDGPYDGVHDPSHSEGDVKAKTVKRPDPPMNVEMKFICDFEGGAECIGLTFDRKCEWSKHMDKHDRPYTCPQPQCAKLQGFTYSGGLLRHEREVHGKHGGPREQLRCSVAGCKRNSGKGFTRKENLNEHLRRVHSINSPDTAAQLRQTASDALPGAEQAMETPASRFSDAAEMEDGAYPIINKRARHEQITSPHSVSSDVEGELARLRQENLEKDQRIQRVEQEHADTQQRLRHLEDMLGQLTSQSLGSAKVD